jgi:hypothetical protein
LDLGIRDIANKDALLNDCFAQVLNVPVKESLVPEG